MHIRPLKGYASFDKVIRQGHKVFHRGIVAFVRLAPQELEDAEQATRTIYYGVTCKRRTRPAVMRNRIKRLLREGMREAARSPYLGPEFWAAWPVQEIVLVWTAIPSHPQLLHADVVARAIEALVRKAASTHARIGSSEPGAVRFSATKSHQSNDQPETPQAPISAPTSAPISGADAPASAD